MGGRGSSSGGAAWKRMTVYEQARAIAERVVPADAGEHLRLADRVSEWAYDKKLEDGSISDAMHSLLLDGEADLSVVRESKSGKAYLMRAESDYGSETFWMPKTWVRDGDKLRQEAVRAEAANIVNANYSRYMRDTAKASGVKVGNLKRFTSIQKKFKEAGVSLPKKYDWSNMTGYQVKSAKELGWE